MGHSMSHRAHDSVMPVAGRLQRAAELDRSLTASARPIAEDQLDEALPQDGKVCLHHLRFGPAATAAALDDAELFRASGLKRGLRRFVGMDEVEA